MNFIVRFTCYYLDFNIYNYYEILADGRVITTLRHSQEHTTIVDGFQQPGSFEQNIMYEADFPQIEALINRSHTCWQRLSYQCQQSRLLNSPCKLASLNILIIYDY